MSSHRDPFAAAGSPQGPPGTPPPSDDHLPLALELCRARRYAEAEALCRRQLAAGGGSSAGRVALATALLGQARLREAAAEAVAVLKQQPGFLPALRILGKSLLLGGRADLAEDVLEEAQAFNPGDRWVSLLLAEARAKLAAAAAASAPPPLPPEPPAAAAAVAPGPLAVAAPEVDALAETASGGDLSETSAQPEPDDLAQTQASDPSLPSVAAEVPVGEQPAAEDPDDLEQTRREGEALSEESIDAEWAPVRPRPSGLGLPLGEEDPTERSLSSPLSPLGEEPTLRGGAALAEPDELGETSPSLPPDAPASEAWTWLSPSEEARGRLRTPRPSAGASAALGLGGLVAPALDASRSGLEGTRPLRRPSGVPGTRDSAELMEDTVPEEPETALSSAEFLSSSSSDSLPSAAESGQGLYLVDEQELSIDLSSQSWEMPPGLEDSLMRAEAILDTLEHRDLPEGPVIAGAGASGASGGGVAASGELPTLRRSQTPLGTAWGGGAVAAPPPLAASPLPSPALAPAAFAAPPMARPAAQRTAETARNPALQGAGARPAIPARRGPAAAATRPATRRPSALPLALGLGLGLFLLLGALLGLLMAHEIRLRELRSLLTEAEEVTLGGSYGRLRVVEARLRAQSEELGPGLGGLSLVVDRVAGLLGRGSLEHEGQALRVWLARSQAQLVLDHGVQLDVPGPGPLPVPGTAAQRAAWASTQLARAEPAEALRALSRELVAASGDRGLLRVRAEALARAGQAREALELLDTIPSAERLPADHLLRGQLLEGRSPELALAEYDLAVQRSGGPRARVLRARLLQKTGHLEASDEGALGQVLDDAEAASPRDRAWAASLLADLALQRNETERARQLLRQAVKLEPREVGFRIAAGRQELAELRLSDARTLLEEGLRLAPGCDACRELLAEVHLAQGDAAGALAWLKSETVPDSGSALLRGRALLDLGQLREAEEQLAAARAGEQEGAAAAPWLALLRVRRGQRRQGLEQFRGLLRQRPDDPELALAHALALREAGQRDRAREEFERAAAGPRGYVAQTERCRMEADLGFGAPALAACRQAARGNPGYLPTWLLLGRIHEAEGRFEEAERAYREVLEVMPLDPQALSGLMSCALAMDRDDEVEGILQKLGGGLGLTAAYYRGLLAERRGELEGAVRSLRKALGQAELGVRALTALGRVYLAQGKEAAARSVLLRAAEGERGDPAAELLLGDLGLKAGDFDAAAEDYRRSLALLEGRLHRPEDPVAALQGLGEAHFRRGPTGFEAAREAFQRAARLDERDGSSRLRLGDIAAQQGEVAEALGHYRAATEADPALSTAWWSLGSLLRRRGPSEEATRALQEYLRREPKGQHARAARRLLEGD